MDFTCSNRPKDSKGISQVLLKPLNKKAPTRHGYISQSKGIALTLIICKV